MSFMGRSCARRALVMAVGFMVALSAPPALADVNVRFETFDGYPRRARRRSSTRSACSRSVRSAPQHPGPQPRHLGERRLLRAARADDRRGACGWQVWAVERRENQLEDHSLLDQAKDGTATSRRCSTTTWAGSPTEHHQPLRAHPRRGRRLRARVGHAGRDRGSAPRRRGAARAAARSCVGGHSLGGSITAAYATWDFDGQTGATGSPAWCSSTAAAARPRSRPTRDRLARRRCRPRSPWLTFGGITAPFAGLFNSTGSLGALLDPDSPSLGQAFPLLPANLKPPIPVTNLAQYGYALDTETSPPSLPRRRHTSATSPRAATRAAGTRPARSRRSSASPRCSPASG